MGNKKILLLIGDGMRPDAILKCGSSFASDFLKNSVYTMNGQTVMPSITLPSHMSLFHGVKPERHGNTSNVWVQPPNPEKGLCEVLSGAGKKCGLFYDCELHMRLALPESLSHNVFIAGTTYSFESSMVRLTDTVLSALKENILDFIFVYFELTDEIGHHSGYMSEEYLNAVKAVWDNIEKISDALPEEFGMIVTADHGGHEYGHGDNVPEDMTIPVIFNGDIFKNMNLNLSGDVNIIDIAPTISKIMGVQPDTEWEGKSLI